jgi:hypothetical protein
LERYITTLAFLMSEEINSLLAIATVAYALTTDVMAWMDSDDEEGRCNFAPAFFVGSRGST